MRKRKAVWLLSGVLIVMIAIAAIVVVAKAKPVKPIDGEIHFYVTQGGPWNDHYVYNSKDYEYHPIEVSPGKTSTLYILNGRKDIDKIYVLISDQEGKIIAKEPFMKKKSTYTIEFEQETSGLYDVSFVLIGENGMEFYVSNEKCFLDITSDPRVKDQSVTLLRNLCIEGDAEGAITFPYPYIWNLGTCTFRTNQAIHFSSKDAGIMYINNPTSDVISTKGITANTPQWDFKLETLFGEFTEKECRYIIAKSINERQIDITSLCVDSQEQFDEILEKVSSDETETIHTLKLPEQVTLLQIVGDYELGTLQIEKELKVELTGNSRVLFDAPHTELVWNGEHSPTFTYVEQYMNVKSYNGTLTDASVGGAGEDMLLSGSLKLSAGASTPFVIDGNYIDLYQGYADTITLEDAKLSYQLSGEGSAKIIKKDNQYYCITTNTQGENWGYKINVIKKEYQLPVIYIETENHVAITSKDTKIPGTFSLDYNGMETFTNIDFREMEIRGRGHSSWKLDKKPYKIKFEDKVSLFGLTAAKEWVLQANHVDKSLIRNKLAMDMGAVLNHVLFIPHSYNVDVFVNGTYMGVYTLTEQIEVKEGRIPGEKDDAAVDTDYLVELGGDEEATSFGTNMFNSPLYNWIEIKNPDTDVLTKEQFDFIKDYIYQADKAAMQLNGYEEYIDIPSLVDFFLLTEFSYNVDGAFRRSDFIMKKADDKLYMATYWDYDYAFGNFWRDSEGFDEWICLGNENTKNYITDSWITYLLEDPYFTAQLKARWNEVGEELYHTAMTTIDEAEKNVSASAEANFARWPGVLGHKTQYQFHKTANISTYEGQLQYLRDFIQKRYEWMDETIGKM